LTSPPPPSPSPKPAGLTSQLGLPSQTPWPDRWGRLATRLDIAPGTPVLIALSGGADSVLLAHLLASAVPASLARAVHVNHGLRGADAARDAEFCASLCRSLGIPFVLRHAELDPAAPNLEARARAVRYRVLLEEARSSGHLHVLTGHHADDALETLMLRWLRGTGLSGLAGLRERLVIPGERIDDHQISADATPDIKPVIVLRPLIAMRREEVRRLLRDRGCFWREDKSNTDPRFTRNRMRNQLLPLIGEHCGDEGLSNLEAFSSAVESLEDDLASATAHLGWRPSSFATASRTDDQTSLGGDLARADLMALSSPLRRRALWRLLSEGTGHPPGRSLLDLLLEDLAKGQCTRHSLPGSWILVMRARELQLVPPSHLLQAGTKPAVDRLDPPATPQALLPFMEPEFESDSAPAQASGPQPIESPHFDLQVPGIVTLPDGRRLSAEILDRADLKQLPRGSSAVGLDARAIPTALTVRFPSSGDRFHPLGAPGSKPLRRFLAGQGVPREERSRVPLVLFGSEILWTVGLRPCEPHRVREVTRHVLLLTLHSDSVAEQASVTEQRPKIPDSFFDPLTDVG
jgi:tRNA(Ile)-lysidine synthase